MQNIQRKKYSDDVEKYMTVIRESIKVIEIGLVSNNFRRKP